MLRQHGFTLIELLISILVMLVLAVIVVPSFADLLARNRLSSQANEVQSLIQLSRSEAIKQNQTLRLCKANATLDGCSSDSGSWNGWLLADMATPAMVIRAGFFDAHLNINPDFQELRFSAQGMIRDQNNQPFSSAFELCASGGFADNGRTVSFISGGVSRIQTMQCSG